MMNVYQLVFIVIIFIEISIICANSVDPDQTSGLGLKCLPISL